MLQQLASRNQLIAQTVNITGNNGSTSNENFDEHDDDLQWYPRRKLNTVRRKLQGDNPVLIIRYVEFA
jgi:hypothetical protein